MNTRCTVCGDLRREQVEAMLGAGWTVRSIAEQFPPLSKDAVNRHRRHMPPQSTAAPPPVVRAMLVSTQQADEALPAAVACHANTGSIARAEHANIQKTEDEMLVEAERIRATGWHLLTRAEGAEELRTSVGALREIRGVAEFKAKLTGRLNESSVNVINIAVVNSGAQTEPDVPVVEIEKTR